MRSSPQPGFSRRHAANQDSEILRQGWPSDRPGLPAPEQPKSLALPSDQSIRFDVDQGVTPGKEPAERGHEPAGGIIRAPRSHLALLVQGELLAEEQVFGSQLSPGSEPNTSRRARSRSTLESSPQTVPRSLAERRWDGQRDVKLHGVTMLKGFTARMAQPVDFVRDFTRTEFLRTTAVTTRAMLNKNFRMPVKSNDRKAIGVFCSDNLQVLIRRMAADQNGGTSWTVHVSSAAASGAAPRCSRASDRFDHRLLLMNRAVLARNPGWRRTTPISRSRRRLATMGAAAETRLNNAAPGLIPRHHGSVSRCPS